MELKKKQKLQPRRRVSDFHGVEQILFDCRQVFVTGPINDELADSVIREIISMDAINNSPIQMYINSGGGDVHSGYMIIDIMNAVRSPVYTLICGEACSMAGMISLYGKERYITKNGAWMGHEMRTDVDDYISKAEDRFKYSMVIKERIINTIKEKTKIPKDLYEKVLRGELWLNAQECIKYGIADKIADKFFGKPKSNRRNNG